MSTEKSVSKSEKQEALPQTVSELQAVIAAAVAAAVAEVAQTQQSSGSDISRLVEAIVESRKPVIDPQAEANRKNEEMFRRQFKQNAEREKAVIAGSQKVCKHIAGSNSLSNLPDPYQRTAFHWHRGDLGLVFGICKICGKVVWEFEQAEFSKYFSQPAYDLTGAPMSEGGRRDGGDRDYLIRHGILRDRDEEDII